MSVYVGKDVNVTIQIPYEEDVSSQANGSNLIFTVSKTPISDRDLDGVANEVEHATAYVNNSQVTVTAVNDSTGAVTLASAPAEGDKVIIEYRYDGTPYYAQEVAIEPTQSIEGVDALGSDTVQVWAALLKEYSGSIKEVYRKREQLDHLNPFLRRYSRDEWTDDIAYWSTGCAEDPTIKYAGSCSINRSSTKGFWNDHLYGGASHPERPFDFSRFKGLGLRFRSDYAHESSYPKIFIVRTDSSEFIGSFSYTTPNTWKYIYFSFGTEERASIDSIRIRGLVSGEGTYGDWVDDLHFLGEKYGGEYGAILKWDQGGSVVRIGLDKVVFPEGSIPSPKNAPVLIVTPFRAQTAKTIS